MESAFPEDSITTDEELAEILTVKEKDSVFELTIYSLGVYDQNNVPDNL